MANSQPSTSQTRSVDAQAASGQGLGKTDSTSHEPKMSGRLMTFKAPTPSQGLIKALNPVNRWLFLGGIPGLRSLPGIGRLPGVRGLTNIPKIDFPKADEQRLARAADRKNVCFIVPNHPEFFTDWMLDKEVMSRVAPQAASWATHGVVNGMGAKAQKFWLKNNLIAQIPGVGGAEARAYSVAWALRGNGVLLHPEGGVGWHGDLIAPLFPGAVTMAIEAARTVEASGKAGQSRKVLVAPVVWKLIFNRDVEVALHKELDYVEDALQLPKTSPADGLQHRLYDAYSALLARHETRHGSPPTSAHYFERQDKLSVRLLALLSDLLDRLAVEAARSETTNEQIRRGERWLRRADKTSDDAKTVRVLTRDLRQLLRFHAAIYPGNHLTQEHIAESIKRIRNDYCGKTTRDTVNKFLPQPAGPRTAYIRVPEPLDISAMMGETSVEALVDDLRRRMQMTLDGINQDLTAAGKFITYPNPFTMAGGMADGDTKAAASLVT